MKMPTYTILLFTVLILLGCSEGSTAQVRNGENPEVAPVTAADDNRVATPTIDERIVKGYYFNPNYGYSIVIPKGLSGFCPRPPLPQHGVRIALSTRPETYVSVNGYYNAAEYQSLDDKVNVDLDLLRKEGTEEEVSRQLSRRLQNLEARQIIVRYKSKRTGEVMIQSIVSAIRNRKNDTGIVYELRLETQETRFDEDNRIFEEVIKSWASSPVK